MDLFLYFVLMFGADALGKYMLKDGLCLPPASVEFVIESCPSQEPTVVWERQNGRWVKALRYPQYITLAACGRRVCVMQKEPTIK